MRYVKTDYDGRSYITAGKVYPISRVDEDGDHLILDDEGDLIPAILESPSALLGCVGTWTECDAEGNEIGGGDE